MKVSSAAQDPPMDHDDLGSDTTELEDVILHYARLRGIID